jgi:hypothetical protein
MRSKLSYLAIAATLALAGPALAQAPSSGPAKAPPTSDPSASPPAAAGTDAAANVGASTSLTTGMSVKDNTGALIGEVTDLKGGVATIKMGSDTFTVDSSKLAVQGGAATINATQAELKKMLPKK